MPRAKHVTEFCCIDPRCEVQGRARTFAKASLLRQHQLKVHAAKTLKCQQCSKAFAVAYLLRQHETECNTMAVCNDCGAKFSYRSSLRRHYKSAKHGPTAGLSSGSSTKALDVTKASSSSKNIQGPNVVTILPLQIVPVFVSTTSLGGAIGTANGPRKERPILPKKVVKKAASVQVARPIQPKLTVSTQVSALDYDPYQLGHKVSQAVDATKTRISVSTSTVTEQQQTYAPSISTQTGPSPTCNVAVGIDEVFDDLQRLFEKSSPPSQTAGMSPREQQHSSGPLRRQQDASQNQHQHCSLQGDCARAPSLLQEVSCSLNGANFHHVETQTYQPRFADTHMQTSYYSDEPFDGSFLVNNDVPEMQNSASNQHRTREPAFVDVGVGGAPFDERIFGHMEVQTTSFPPQVQHFGMQTAPSIGESSVVRHGNIAETQTLCVPALDGFSQTGSMELSSVETQTIEQFLNCLENS